MDQTFDLVSIFDFDRHNEPPIALGNDVFLEGDPTSLDILLGSVVALPTLQRNISATILSEDEIADNARDLAPNF